MRMRCERHGGEGRCMQGCWWKTWRRETTWEDLEIDGRKYWKGSWRNRMGKCKLDMSGSGYGQVIGSSERSNKPSGSTECRELFDWLNVIFLRVSLLYIVSCYSTLQQNWQIYSMLTVYHEVSQSWGNVQCRSYINSCPRCWGIILCCIQGLWMNYNVFDTGSLNR